ncbi:MAG: tetratricopeptide repeat protein [Pyrinomonadaceae bacterium]
MKKIYLSLFVFCTFLVSTVTAQEPPAAPSPDKKEAKAAAPSPSPSPSPTTFSTLDQPDFKAYTLAMREKDPTKKLTVLEKFVNDFPKSFLLPTVRAELLNTVIKIDPNNKERIYEQALKTIASVKTEFPFGSPAAVSNTYNSVVIALYGAKMDDKAEEIAQKGIALIDEVSAKTVFAAKYPMWLRLGQIYLRKNDMKTAEKYFNQSITGDYEGNAALLGLAEIAGKRKKGKQQLAYLLQADAKGAMKREQRAALETLYVKQHGSAAGLREMLDENYKRANPFPFTVAKYTPTAQRSKRTVLAELFTGAECHPCITADTAFEAFLERYNPAEVAVLIYDLHIPSPDPITNPATVARAKFYKASSTPTYFINGNDRQSGGGVNRKESEFFYNKITPLIDAQLEKPNEADLQLSATLENNVIKTTAKYDNLKGDYSGLRLYIGLVENELSYMGGNGVRFHPMVVRELGGTDRDGFALKDKSGRIEWQFDLQKVSLDLKNYIDKYEQEQQKDDKNFAFAEKKYDINPKNLSVIAFIQDEKTKNVLQSAFVNLSETKSAMK